MALLLFTPRVYAAKRVRLMAVSTSLIPGAYQTASKFMSTRSTSYNVACLLREGAGSVLSFPFFPFHQPHSTVRLNQHTATSLKMSDTWMVRPDYADFAKSCNAAGASISSIFLSTRLFLRTTQYSGLWWDDCFRKSSTDRSLTLYTPTKVVCPDSTIHQK